MSSTIYPAEITRKFEHRWVTRMADAKTRKPPARPTDECACGHVVTAPFRSSYSVGAVINDWRCSACSLHWQSESLIA